ncbi:MAG: MFS transporter [Hyphomicrobiales bacterium]|nr:MAG: MFS transporter [Hyphomicrobiales bacterium]
MTERTSLRLPLLFWGLAALFYFYGFFQRVAPSVMVQELMRDFSVSAAVLGNLSAFYFYAYASIQLPVGLIVDRYGPRRALTLAALLCGLGSLIFGLAASLPMAYTGRLLVGAGAGFTWVGALKVISLWFPARRFALMSGLTLMLGMIGAVAGQGPLAALVGAFGWRDVLLAAALIVGVLAAAIWFIIPAAPAPDKAAPEGPGIRAGLGRVLKNPQSWVVALFGAMMTAPMLSFAGLWAVPYLMLRYHIDRPAAAFAVSFVFVGWGAGAPLLGWLSDHLERRKPVMIVSAATALASISAIIYWPGLPLWAATLLCFVNGFGSGGMVLCFAAGREHNAPESAGAALGFVNMAVMSTGAIFQPLIGWLLDRNWAGLMQDGARVYGPDAYQAALLTQPACGIAAVLAAMLVTETYCATVAEAKPG